MFQPAFLFVSRLFFQLDGEASESVVFFPYHFCLLPGSKRSEYRVEVRTQGLLVLTIHKIWAGSLLNTLRSRVAVQLYSILDLF